MDDSDPARIAQERGVALRALLSRDAAAFDQELRRLGFSTLGQRIRFKALLLKTESSPDDIPDKAELELEDNGDGAGGLELEDNGDGAGGLELEDNGDGAAHIEQPQAGRSTKNLDDMLYDISSDDEDDDDEADAGAFAPPPVVEDPPRRRKKEPGYYDYDPEMEDWSGDENDDSEQAKLRRAAADELERLEREGVSLYEKLAGEGKIPAVGGTA